MTFCKMCGFKSEVGGDGRCRLGHRVRPPDPDAATRGVPRSMLEDGIVETISALYATDEPLRSAPQIEETAPDPAEPVGAEPLGSEPLPPLPPAAAEIRKTLLRMQRHG